MNHNMKKMYSEQEVVDLIKQAISSGEISGGTKLYKHTIVGTYEDVNSEEFTLNCVLINDSSEQITDIEDVILAGAILQYGVLINASNQIVVRIITLPNGQEVKLVGTDLQDNELYIDYNEEFTITSDTVTPL